MKLKRISALVLALVMALSLCACGGSSELGKYNCTSIVMNGMDLGAGQEWIELKEDGAAVLFIQNETHTATYTLDGNVISVSLAGQEVGAGVLEDGKLTMDLMGMTCIFQQEGAE